MKILKLIGATLAATLIAAGCGGGSTLSGNNSGGASTAATVKVVATPATIAADGSTTSAITATVLDINNAGVANATVTFGASAGGAIAVVKGTTDASGIATATLSNTGATAGTNITVAAAAGTVQGTATVAVIAVQETLTLTTDLPNIPSNSTKSATVQALLRDASNNVKSGVLVTFSSDSGTVTPVQTAAGAAASPQVPAGTTDANGVAAAAVNAGGDFTDRTITVTSSGATAAPATILVTVSGTQLTLSGQPALVAGTSSPFTALLTDSAGTGIANQTVTFASSAGNALAPATAQTDSGGHAVTQVTASVAGADTITAKSLGLTATATVSVSSETFAFTAPLPVAPATQVLIPLDTIPPTNTPVTVSVKWTSNGAPVVGQQVSFATTRGSILSPTSPYAVINPPTVVTDSTGTATVTVASSLAGPAIIAATASGVSAQIPVTFVARTANSVAVQASPATVPINGTSTIVAVVRDVNNNLVQGATVDFNLTVDPTGGSLSVPSAVTDVQGRAQTVFTASSTTSAANGITVTASVEGSAVTGSTTLSVGGQTVFLSLGTGNKISAPNNAEYEQDWAVQALDSHGGAVVNQPITVQILPLYYYKGFRYFNTTVWQTVNSVPNCPPSSAGNLQSPDCLDPKVYLPANFVFVPNGTQCANEDVGYTGIFVASEDVNSNGKLDPGNVASATPSTGGVTDANGTLLVQVVWPQDHSYYVGVRIIATTTVQGTQSSTSADFLLPGLASDFNQSSVEPPGPVSPYGKQNSPISDCSDKY